MPSLLRTRSRFITFGGKYWTLLHQKRSYGLPAEKESVLENVTRLCNIGNLEEAVNQLDYSGVDANFSLFRSLLRACGNVKALQQGRQIHKLICKSKLHEKTILVNQIIEMYGKCASLDDARAVFDNMHQRNVFSWTAMMAAYAENGQEKKALQLWPQMQMEDVKPDNVIFIMILKACSHPSTLEEGKLIHANILEGGHDFHVVVETSLVNMYANCGSLEDASRIFKKMSLKDAVTWNTMIAAYSHHGHEKEALNLFWQMFQVGMQPTRVTFVNVLTACSCQMEGKLIHAHIFYYKTESDVVILSSLINMYGNCGTIESSLRVFAKLHQGEVTVWNAMITAHTHCGQTREALCLYRQMRSTCTKPNKITFITILSACCSAAVKAEGKVIHAHIIDCGFESDNVIGSALLNMYGKCESLEDGRRVFEEMPKQDVISWTAMIAAYAQHDQGQEALKLFQLMQMHCISPNRVTIVTILDVCADLAALEEGTSMYAYIINNGFDLDVVIGTALVNLYGKCGGLDAARNIFNKLPWRNLFTWNAMISAYAQYGWTEESLELFNQMHLDHIMPDEISFISILSGCSHVGLGYKGFHWFVSMNQGYNVTATEQHYGCLIDLLGRTGWLDEAEDFVNKMPIPPDVVAWRALLGACNVHGEMRRGQKAAKQVIKLDPCDAGAYILLSNIYLTGRIVY